MANSVVSGTKSPSAKMQFELFESSSRPWTPHLYQKRAVKFLLEHAAGALFLEPGLGKSAITLAALKVLKAKGMVDKTLLIAPLRVCTSVWPKEIEKWTDFNGFKTVVLHGPKKDELLQQDADLYIINPDGLEWLLQVTKWKTHATNKTKVAVDLKRWRALGFDTLVVDELSKFKHIGTNRFKALKQVLHTFGRRWGLTGSPAANGLLDLFGQCFVLDEGRSLGKYVSHYRMKYFIPSWDGFNWNLRDGADKEIYDRLKPLVLRMAAADYLEMPQLIENNIKVELPDQAMGIYNKLEQDLIARIEDRTVVAANAAAASTKCRQVANGGIYLDAEMTELLKPKAKREWLDLHTTKVDALVDLIEELQGEPLLVAYDFEHDLARLKARLGKDVPHIGGGVTAKQSAEIADRWNQGKLPILLGHPQAMAHGLNLQEVGHHICWHSLTWNYELYDQFIRRVLRQGSKAKKVFVHHLIARNTIDEAILAAVKSKRRGQDALFEALQRRVASRRPPI